MVHHKNLCGKKVGKGNRKGNRKKQSVDFLSPLACLGVEGLNSSLR